MVEAWGGKFETWKVIRPGTGATTGHASETSVDEIECDRGVYNDRTLFDLSASVHRIMCRMELNDA